MDTAALSIALSQSSVQQQASLAVMKNAMDTAKLNSDNILQMLNQSALPTPTAHHSYLGTKIGISV